MHEVDKHPVHSAGRIEDRRNRLHRLYLTVIVVGNELKRKGLFVLLTTPSSKGYKVYLSHCFSVTASRSDHHSLQPVSYSQCTMFINQLALLFTLGGIMSGCGATDNNQMFMTDDGRDHDHSSQICYNSYRTSIGSTIGSSSWWTPVYFEQPELGKLNIRYGRCYYLTDLNGNGITRYLREQRYYFGNWAETRDIIMRICRGKDVNDCNSQQNVAVEEDQSWTMWDSTGMLGANTKGNFVGGNTVELFLINPGQQNYIVDFRAKMKCLHGKCAPCVRLSVPEKGLPTGGRSGLVPRGLDPRDDIITPNTSDACLPMLFEPTNCPTVTL